MSPSASNGVAGQARILLFPSAGMGHLVPFARLSTALSARGIDITLLAARPTVSAAESRLLSSLPSSIVLDFPLAPLDPSLFPPFTDPFFLRMESIRRSVPLLTPLLSSFSALVVDIFSASTFLPVASAMSIPCFILSTSSAAMLALITVFRSYGDVSIADICKIPSRSLPPPLRDPNHLFTRLFVDNGRAITLSDGIIMNTFEAFEPEMVAALHSGKVEHGFPPAFDIGPLPLLGIQQSSSSRILRWLDEQPERSVMYVSFGSRTAISRDQIRELGAGLELSGCRFLWVVRSAKVDREEAAKIEELVGEGYVERVDGRGLVVREWVEQESVLAHRAVAGFLSHCGWNSVIEAAAAGVRVLAWPRMGDQRVNAEVVEASVLGVWPEEWAWEAEEGLVAAEEIGRRVKEVMHDAKIGEAAARVAVAAAAAVAEGGSSDKSIKLLIEKISK